MRSTLIVLLLAAISGISFADTEDAKVAPPKSRAAQAAMAKAEKGRREADAAWAKATAEYKKAELKDLKAAQAAALKANDIDEATSIAALVKSVDADVQALAGTVTYIVRAKDDWKVVGELPRGTYAVTAKGKWTVGSSGTCDADGLNEEFMYQGHSIGRNGQLVANIVGQKKEVLLGTHATLEITDEHSKIMMRCTGWHQEQNEGELTVTLVRQ